MSYVSIGIVSFSSSLSLSLSLFLSLSLPLSLWISFLLKMSPLVRGYMLNKYRMPDRKTAVKETMEWVERGEREKKLNKWEGGRERQSESEREKETEGETEIPEAESVTHRGSRSHHASAPVPQSEGTQAFHVLIPSTSSARLATGTCQPPRAPVPCRAEERGGGEWWRGEERMGEEKRGEERRDMGRRGMWKGFDAVVIEKSYKVKTLSQERD